MTGSRFRTLIVAALALLTLPACDSGKLKVAIVTNNAADFWNMCEDGARDAGQKYDVEVLFHSPSPDTTDEQKKIIDTLLDDGVSGLAVSVIDPVNQTKYLNTVAARANLLAMDNDAPESDRLYYIGTDNVAAGRAAGELVLEAMPEGGHYAIFVGRTNSLNAQQREQGVLEVLKGAPNADQYTRHGQTYTDETDTRRAKTNASTVLEALAPKIQAGETVCLIGLWAYNPPAILAAVEEKGLQGKVKIVGFDENDETLLGIEQGDIYGTVVQNPYRFGFDSVRILAGLAKGDESVKPEDELFYIPHRIFTKDGGEGRFRAAEFDEEYEQQRERLMNE